ILKGDKMAVLFSCFILIGRRAGFHQFPHMDTMAPEAFRSQFSRSGYSFGTVPAVSHDGLQYLYNLLLAPGEFGTRLITGSDISLIKALTGLLGTINAGAMTPALPVM